MFTCNKRLEGVDEGLVADIKVEDRRLAPRVGKGVADLAPLLNGLCVALTIGGIIMHFISHA